MLKPFFVRLGSRGRIRIAGVDRHAFLQAIVSNDLRLLDSRPAVYTCLLSPQGKFLHDFFVTRVEDSLLLDCEPGARADDLRRKLLTYKLRSKVEIALEDGRTMFAVLGNAVAGGFSDPREMSLGCRTYDEPAELEERPFAVWDEIRIRLGLPDGSRDMEVGKDTLLDCNIDKAHGVSFDKGCYVGQEITARMQLRGLVKKHLVPVTGQSLPPPFADIVIAGQVAGQMRSSSGTIGLALLKDEALALLGTDAGIAPLANAAAL